MTAADSASTATLFVTNVLNGTVVASPNTINEGTVVRIGLSIPSSGAPRIASESVIGSGFPERTDPAALVVGPTGVGLAGDATLYVADSVANRIAAISNALHRTTSSSGTTISVNGALNDPLGLAIAPNGNILTVNGGDGNLSRRRPPEYKSRSRCSTPARPHLGPTGTAPYSASPSTLSRMGSSSSTTAPTP